ncbi:structural maintenance of chromosomes protein 3-like [Anopheles cruzii]|uniref:structural maintenance of chromosomes protein 3-like n=1 Tax=Anopheles cruzii TaxID=68878 RepID=UPI0022EC870D|nr:structural maintenance of chromosomes protein 3-like [Anopheles cruzii]
MYIKQVVIQGFKSYGHKTVVDPFDKRHNVVIGRNSSGKSNFFSAIEFVISDEFNNIPSGQRMALINKEVASRSATAFVEIVFDNSNCPIQRGEQDIRVRRTITKSMDQYLLNGKVTPRKEIVEFLETLGLSISNPYYIVKQGKINKFATARPPQLLQVLFEIADIRVYNERRQNSLKLLKTSCEDMKHINKSLSTIQQHMNALAKEKGVLENYDRLDKDRRALEWVILEKEHMETSAEINALDLNKSTLEETKQELEKKTQRLRKEIDQKERILMTIQRKLENEKQTQIVLTQEHNSLEKRKAALELKLSDLYGERTRETTSKEDLQSRLSELNKEIAFREDKFTKLSRQHANLAKEEDVLNGKLLKRKQQRNELLDKLRRSSQFASQVERDHWLNKELVELKDQIASKQSVLLEAEREFNIGSEKCKLQSKIIGKQQQVYERMLQEDAKYKMRLNELKVARIRYQTSIEQLLANESLLMQQLCASEDDHAKLDQNLCKRIGKATRIGCDSAHKVLDWFRSQGAAQQHVVDGYYGLVADNFSCPSNIEQAVEVTAGNQLFYHIVATDQISAKMLRKFNECKLPGELHFMPLNRLNGKKIQYPAGNDDLVPLISLLKYDQRFELVYQHIFGRTLLCNDLELATQVAKRSALACVTYEGDQVRSSGPMKGGHHRYHVSILRLHCQVMDTRAKITQMEEQLLARQELLASNARDLEGCDQELDNVELKLNKLGKSIAMSLEEKQRLPERFHQQSEQATNNESRVRTTRTEIELLLRHRKALSDELGKDMNQQHLSQVEQQTLQKLDNKIRQLEARKHETFTERLDVEVAKNKLNNLLHSNLLRQREELCKPLDSNTLHADIANSIDICRQQTAELENKIRAVQHQKDECEKRIAAESIELQNNMKEVDASVQTLRSLEEDKAENSQHLNPRTINRSTLGMKLGDIAEKMANLGALPSVDPKFHNSSMKELMSQLDRTKKKLEKIGSINQTAIEEFLRLSSDMKQNYIRLDELGKAREILESSLCELETYRAETIETTFNNVNRNFGTIFKKLVPAGNGYLTLRTAADNDDENNNQPSSDRYTGIGIQVAFAGDGTDMCEMSQLSGGQKTVVSLALIFALQQFNPAPFYLFDEIDQALDLQYRRKVASIIGELSNQSQFITTTFRPELLTQAQQFYGVRCRNKISHIDKVSKEQAEDFITDTTVHG